MNSRFPKFVSPTVALYKLEHGELQIILSYFSFENSASHLQHLSVSEL